MSATLAALFRVGERIASGDSCSRLDYSVKAIATMVPSTIAGP